jgi:hypothetical protein
VDHQPLNAHLLDALPTDPPVHRSGISQLASEPIWASEEPVVFDDSSWPVRSRKRRQVGGGDQAPKVRAIRRKKQKRSE